MRKSRFTDSQIMAMLKQNEDSTKVALSRDVESNAIGLIHWARHQLLTKE